MSFGLSHKAVNGCLSSDDIEANFSDLHQPLNLLQAKAEASRCLYCFDAPCITACPTSIDIPTFIHQIRTENINGSAKTILSENIMGGTCARACPTEVLCEQACVLNKANKKAVAIGSLQRYAVDSFIDDKPHSHPFKRKVLTGKSIAIIGAGPAGMACAHRAALLGHQVTIFEAKSKAGGLNEYGLAAYKMVDNFAQKEVEFILNVGGISIEYNKAFNHDIFLPELQQDYDAVFIAVGLSKVNQLGIEGEDEPCVIDAIDFIESLRQSKNKSAVKVGNDVVVIGAGNTAIDAAIQAKRLGADNVTLVYRRGESAMSATDWEIDLARRNDVRLQLWASPHCYVAKNSSMEFKATSMKDGKLVVSEELITIKADMVLKAIGQKIDTAIFPDLANGKIKISELYETTIKGVFAGGDCVDRGQDLTVQAVQDGKVAAQAIDRFLCENSLSDNTKAESK